MSDLCLGIDVGTSGVRIAAIDRAAKIRGLCGLSDAGAAPRWPADHPGCVGMGTRA